MATAAKLLSFVPDKIRELCTININQQMAERKFKQESFNSLVTR